MKSCLATITLCLFLSISLLTAQAPNKPLFERLTTSQGLPGRQVKALVQDSRGFMWVGGALGISRYDGYNFKNYSYDPANSSAIGSVSCIIEDKKGGLWIGTAGDGAKYFDVKAGKFMHYRHDENDPNSLAGHFVNQIYEDSQENIWIATFNTGLNKLVPENGQFVHYRHIPEDTASLSDDWVRIIFEDSKNNLWIGTSEGGLHLFDREKEAFSNISALSKEDAESGMKAAPQHVSDIFEDESGRLWITAYGEGLFLFDGHSFIRFPARSE